MTARLSMLTVKPPNRRSIQEVVDAVISRHTFTAVLPPLSDVWWKRLLFSDDSDFRNDQLEFLGDAVIYATLTHVLFNKYPTANAHIYTQCRSALLSNATFCRISSKLDLSELDADVRKSLENKGFGRHCPVAKASKSSTKPIADLFETITAAYFIQAGFEATCEWTFRIFAPLIGAVREQCTLTLPRKRQVLSTKLPGKVDKRRRGTPSGSLRALRTPIIKPKITSLVVAPAPSTAHKGNQFMLNSNRSAEIAVTPKSIDPPSTAVKPERMPQPCPRSSTIKLLPLEIIDVDALFFPGSSLENCIDLTMDSDDDGEVGNTGYTGDIGNVGNAGFAGIAGHAGNASNVCDPGVAGVAYDDSDADNSDGDRTLVDAPCTSIHQKENISLVLPMSKDSSQRPSSAGSDDGGYRSDSGRRCSPDSEYDVELSLYEDMSMDSEDSSCEDTDLDSDNSLYEDMDVGNGDDDVYQEDHTEDPENIEDPDDEGMMRRMVKGGFRYFQAGIPLTTLSDDLGELQVYT
ncbi:hypothetical protein K474DRAFT_1768042 [Panus rudis PR-1116 ss-1]|nr:hypothetical protein K474DRAFT_1768042 [Panus rudis PR-1116 ss-1]